jgi:hypothetical protein
MDLDAYGIQHEFEPYESYLAMLCAYLNEDGSRIKYIKDRIVYNSETGQYTFKFKNRKPIYNNAKISADAVKI